MIAHLPIQADLVGRRMAIIVVVCALSLFASGWGTFTIRTQRIAIVFGALTFAFLLGFLGGFLRIGFCPGRILRFRFRFCFSLFSATFIPIFFRLRLSRLFSRPGSFTVNEIVIPGFLCILDVGYGQCEGRIVTSRISCSRLLISLLFINLTTTLVEPRCQVVTHAFTKRYSLATEELRVDREALAAKTLDSALEIIRHDARSGCIDDAADD